jgi:hypothetical protein
MTPVEIDDVSLVLIAEAVATMEPEVLERLARFLAPERYEVLCQLVLDATEVEERAA